MGCGELRMDYQSALKIAVHGNTHKTDRKGKVRRFYYYNGKSYVYSNVVWCLHNPTSNICAGELVHHANNLPLDNKISNLEKMSFQEHGRLHRAELSSGEVSRRTRKQWATNPPYMGTGRKP